MDVVTMDLRSKLPYTEATVSEIQRLASVLPIAPPRLATKDISLGGYNIPKGTPVQCNLYSIHRNPEVWPEPDEFRPERFLTTDGSEFKPNDWLQPFGYGASFEALFSLSYLSLIGSLYLLFCSLVMSC